MIKNMINAPLTVYKASAGSGKTFTLAVEFIKLLINNPSAYRETLAVTFTNKATEEMKMRILSQLYGLANRFSDSKNYMKKITEELGVSEEVVAANARQALHGLLHDYSSFRVETIDKFFQRVLKNLARELDLNANLRLELNDKQVEHLAVDMMIENLSPNDQMLGWLMDYIDERIGDDKNWNVIGAVKQFGQNIFDDTYKSHREDIALAMKKQGFFEQLTKQLREKKRENLETMAAYGQRFFELTQGLTVNDFYYGQNGVYNYFRKLRDGEFDGEKLGTRVESCLTDKNKWAASKTPHRADIIRLAEDQLIDLLKEAEDHRRTCYFHINSAQLILDNLNQLRLLESIEKVVRDFNSDSSRFLLSDTQGMLHALIGNDDAPFIFEKIGATLRNIMIDEFQDTGALQWSNFKVLLDNCMSQPSHNLIVGDVKQSIYRWRSGDWGLLNNITSQWKNDVRMVKEVPLGTNYRSTRRVVQFNNTFFTIASDIEYKRLHEQMGDDASQMKKAYSDVIQEIPDGKADEGYVHVELMDEAKHEESIMERIAETITSLIDHGVKQKDIAILSRNNSDIEKTANYFQANHPEINIISDEAFRLDSSLAVNVIITALRVVADMKDIISKAALAKAWNIDILSRKDITDADIILASEWNDPLTAFSDFLPEGFRSTQDIAHLHALPLTDLVEAIYHLFELDRIEGQSPYICAFHDTLTEYLNEHVSDVDEFLEEWDDNLHSNAIHGESVEGVRMVTIHKSKGLEYDNVLLPFCNWPLEKSHIIWCKTEEEPYSALPIIPINFKKGMCNSVYEGDYYKEHLQNIVDNLNLLYVAFTRAKTRLFVYGIIKDKKNKKEESTSRRSWLIECTLRQMLYPKDSQPSITDFTSTVTDKELILDYGKCFDEEEKHNEAEAETKNVFLQPQQPETFTMVSYPSKVTFLQSNNSREFTETEQAELQRNEYIRRGNLLHSIFSRLRDLNDLERVVRQLSYEGVLFGDISKQHLQKMIDEALSLPQVREWFSPRWTLHNECAIVFVDEDGKTVTRRPDRVMSDGDHTIVVDFKFGRPTNKHKEQIEAYKDLLRQMGHTHVEGYLWYVSDNNVVPV